MLCLRLLTCALVFSISENLSIPSDARAGMGSVKFSPPLLNQCFKLKIMCQIIVFAPLKCREVKEAFIAAGRP